MDQVGNSTTAGGRRKSKRIWTPFEDEELIKALYELSLDPRWKGEGGFKNGYCSVLENVFAEKIPGCGLTAVPHVESRVRHFRTKYGAIEVMLSKSGFSWDDNRNMLQCEKQQYDTHCKDNIEAKGLYGVPFPHFNTLAAIWGKDIATGEGAEGLGEAITNLEKELTMEESHRLEEEEDREMSREAPRPSLDNYSADSSTSSTKRRRKEKDNGKGVSLAADPLLALVTEFRGDLQNVSKNFGDIAAAIQHEAIQEKARKEEAKETIEEKSVKELRKLGFTGTEVIKAASVFVRIPNQMTMLFAIPESLRREFILNMLEEEANKK